MDSRIDESSMSLLSLAPHFSEVIAIAAEDSQPFQRLFEKNR
jgi:hypothetical protein